MYVSTSVLLAQFVRPMQFIFFLFTFYFLLGVARWLLKRNRSHHRKFSSPWRHPCHSKPYGLFRRREKSLASHCRWARRSNLARSTDSGRWLLNTENRTPSECCLWSLVSARNWLSTDTRTACKMGLGWVNASTTNRLTHTQTIKRFVRYSKVRRQWV